MYMNAITVNYAEVGDDHLPKSFGLVRNSDLDNQTVYNSNITEIPGTKIKPGRTIYLTINSNGSKRIELPDLADNCSRREAEDKLKTLGFKLGATEFIIGDPDWVYEVKVNGKTVKAGTRISVDLPITLVVGKGGLEDEYNGNDSLDYIFNAPFETDEPLEGEVTDAPQDNAQPEEDYFGEE